MTKYKELDINKYLFGKNYFIYSINNKNNKLVIGIKSKQHSCKCPLCGVESTRVASTYHRILQDTPIHNTPTYIDVNAYKYYCLNVNCPQYVFAEKLPFARTDQVRTDALNMLILAVSIFLSNEGASRVLALVGVKISNDSIQKLYDHIEFKDNPDVEAIGVDDVATRKGRNYDTAIYDLEDHHLMALLSGRKGSELKAWLKSHRKIKIIARDRDNAYAEAIREVLPNCIQVADRFHLLQNLSDNLYSVLKKEIPKTIFLKDNNVLKKPPKKIFFDKESPEDIIKNIHYDNRPPIRPDGGAIRFDSKLHNFDSKQYKIEKKNRLKKQNIIRQIQADYSLNKQSINLAAKKFNLNKVTVRKYLKMKLEEIDALAKPNNYKKRKTIMDNYLNIIYKMMLDGQPDNVIYFYVISKGYHRSKDLLRQYICFIEKNNFPKRVRHGMYYFKESAYPEGIITISRKAIFKEIFKPKTSNTFKIIQNHFPILKLMKSIYTDFHTSLMGTDPKTMDFFLEKYRDTFISGFCDSIKKDIASVDCAISLNISSGFVEGNNNKFKLIKRILYGRSGLVNLFKKSCLAFLATLNGFDLGSLLFDNLI